MKKIWPWLVSLGVVLIVLGGGYLLMNRGIKDHSFRKIELGGKEMEVEVVNTDYSIMTGLSGRETLPKDGMLFIMPKADKYGFWMKEMKFPLDLVWISNGEIIEITTDVPYPAEQNSIQQLPIYSPQQEVDMVLEVGGGDAAVRGLAVGDKLVIK